MSNGFELIDEPAASSTREPIVTGHRSSVRSVKVSPNGGLLATASDDTTIRIWSAASGSMIMDLQGHTDWVLCLSFSLFRLYFGKTLGSLPSRFINPNNFPLDAARYHQLWQEHQDDLSPEEEVAEGMGEMLSRIHWIAGYDARDVEFVMAGAPYAAITRLYVVDFNQMRAIDRDADDVSPLVDAFFSNDPYYPRPVPNDALYEIFVKAYMDSCTEDRRRRAALFLQAIEARQAATNAAVQTTV